MSTSYFFVCDQCRKGINIGSDSGFTGFIFYWGEPDCMIKLTAFLNEHHSCRPRPRLSCEDEFFDLCDEDNESPYEEIEWKAKRKAKQKK